MERRQLGKTGLLVPPVGLGTYRVFNVRDDIGEARCEATITAALETGAGFFDTSPMFGEAERVLGLGLAGRREQAIISTKVWARSRAQGEEQIERALELFERVDLYQVHNLLGFRDYAPYLGHLREGGRIAAVGGSHYLPSQMPALIELMEEGALGAVEIPYNPLQRTAEEALLPCAERLGVGVIAMMPFAGGRLVKRSPAPEALQPLERYGVNTWAQALLKWCLSDRRVHVVIPATSSPTRMAENAKAGSPPWFGPSERDLVATLARELAADE